MSQEAKATLSKNNLRRMQGWARVIHPQDWNDRCAIVVEYLAQLDEDDSAQLLRKDWDQVFAKVEADWPEAFVALNAPATE